MMQKLVFSLAGLVIGLLLALSITSFILVKSGQSANSFLTATFIRHNEVIGFLPYWLTDRAKKDYSKYITTLTYFGLNIDDDGNIKKLANLQEDEPGWAALSSGKITPFLSSAKINNVKLSLLVFNGDQYSIDELLSDPIPHARNLVSSSIPIMTKYGFTDLNIDIERTAVASDSARNSFRAFIQEVKKDLPQQKPVTLTIEVSPSDLIEHDLIYLRAIAPLADTFVIMAYDYHFPGSFVTGPVAPLYGAGIISEYDTQAAVEKALALVPAQKILLGIPSYGYEWQTIGSEPRSAVIPDSGAIASNARVEQMLSSCATCSAKFDTYSQETYDIFKKQDTNTYDQMFFPTKQSTQAKVNFASDNHLGGVAVWALGYEGKTLLDPLQAYKNKLLF